MQVVQCFFENSYYDTNVYHLESLGTGHSVSGPAILMETNRYNEWCCTRDLVFSIHKIAMIATGIIDWIYSFGFAAQSWSSLAAVLPSLTKEILR